MIFAIVLFSLSSSLYFLYFLITSNKVSKVEELIALLTGLAMIGIILSLEAFFLNYAKYNDTSKNRKKSIIGMVCSIGAIVVFFGYLVFKFILRIHQVGGVLF